MLLILSLLLLAQVSLRWARRISEDPADRFWIVLAVAMLEVGAITGVTSVLHAMTVAGWLLTQGLLCAVTMALTGGAGGLAPAAMWATCRRIGTQARSFVGRLSGWGIVLLCSIVGVVLSALTRQVLVPLGDSDDWLYHATRVIYWMQDRSAFPYDAHVIQQTIVPFGSELFFLWPVLLTRTEAVGRLVFGLALPLAAVGQYLLLRALGQGRTVALFGTLILVSTPLVLTSATGLKPELWAVLTLLGMAWWAVTLDAPSSTPRVRCVFLGLFAVLSINIRSFPVVCLPVLALVAWCAPVPPSRWPRLKSLALGGLCAVFLSTLWIPLAFNTARYGHPMGPEPAQRAVRARIAPRVAYTHAIRFAFLMAELPWVPASPQVLEDLSRMGNRVITGVGAGRPLPGERSDQPWPGRFVYTLPAQASHFSLWGLLWLPVLVAALVHLVRNGRSTWPHVRWTRLSVLTMLTVPLWAATVFGARWLVGSDVPGRFLVGPYALVLSMGVVILAPHGSRNRFTRCVGALALVYAAFFPVRDVVQAVWQGSRATSADSAPDEPYGEVTHSILAPGSRVLLVGDMYSREYPLFFPRMHYANVVIPWGMGPFDADRMRHLLDTERITHVLVNNDRQAVFLWTPPKTEAEVATVVWSTDTRAFVQYFRHDATLREIPLRTPHQRLYEVAGGTLNETPFGVKNVPSSLSLISIAPDLNGLVGLDPAVWHAPWGVEDTGDHVHGFLWLGQGYPEGLEFALWSRQTRDVDMALDLMGGPSVKGDVRRFMLLHDDVPVGDERTLQKDGPLQVALRLHPGRNIISVMALDAATPGPLSNGDPRSLLVGLRDIRVQAARTQTPDNPAPDDTLAARARRAVGLINRHQQADGYWFTSYTGGTAFEQPRLEMNTYVTALMVDLLSTPSVPAGLAGSVARAKSHLHDQIEADGLVRYHGNPAGRASKETGMCTITPDADDTALVWRIAPGTDAARASALAILGRFRTDAGLYQTWLARPQDFTCLNVGDDPDPADVGIQMHVLMWLYGVDPAAARTLCSALRQNLDLDRLWVYYRKAPLVPILRLADLRARGCDLALPPLRVETDVPGQEVWLDAVRMLDRLTQGGEPVPAPADVRRVLDELSQDHFSAVRHNPPLLYHNDLSASVPRFYWSEDVGYAIWLRLYRASGEGRS